MERRTVHGETVKIADLVGEGRPRVLDTLFDGCHIEGPAVIIPVNGSGIEPPAAFWQVPFEATILDISEGYMLLGGVLVHNCVFRNCSFRAISFALAPVDAGHWRRKGAGFDLGSN